MSFNAAHKLFHRVFNRRRKLFWGLLTIFLLIVMLNSLFLCKPAPPDPAAFNSCHYTPLINSKTCTIELLVINNISFPYNSIEKAVEKFGGYITGKPTLSDPTVLSLPANQFGQITREQLELAINESKDDGLSGITLVVVPGLDDKGSLGFCKKPMIYPNNKIQHAVVINAGKINSKAHGIRFLHRNIWCSVVLHELCHTLGIPIQQSDRCKGSHCRNPECILYPTIDRRSICTAIKRLNYPHGLCNKCQSEIRSANLNKVDMGIVNEKEQLIQWSNELVHLNPDRVDPLLYRFQLYVNCKNYSKAFDDIKNATDMEPENIQCIGRFAWFLATCPNGCYRDGLKAVFLAKRACDFSGWKSPEHLDTLAAAYAEVSDFTNAIICQTNAIELFHDNPIPEDYLQRLNLYKKNIPYRVK